MLIILEGPDCTQKSTLAARLADTIKRFFPRDAVEVLHRGPPKWHPLDEYVTSLLGYRPNADRHIICDRWHWGEWVYPRLLDRPSKMDDQVFHYVELFLRSRGAFVVQLSQNVAVTERCIRERGDALIRPESARMMHALYDGVAGSSRLRMLRLEHAVDSMRIIELARAAERSVPLGANRAVTAVGNWDAKTIIFGDRRGCDGQNCRHNTHHARDGTAFMPYRATSGHYLLTALGVLVDALYVNACEDDPHDVYHTMKFKFPGAIALGANADRRLTQAEVPHATAPHPQFIRRFHHRDAQKYGNLIMELIGTERNELKWRP